MKRRRLPLILTAAVLVPAALLPIGCRGVRYGIGSYFRAGPNYDALEAERASLTGEGAVAPAERSGASATPPYWTRYRGPTADGVYDEQPLDLDWPEGGPAELWRVSVGPAYSSIVVAGGLAITMEQRRDQEFVAAFTAEGGEVAWEHAWDARFYEGMSKEGPRGTPIAIGDAVVALGSTGELRCLDLATGSLRWRHGLAREGEKDLTYGICASPVEVGGLVVAQGTESVFAFDLATGEERWTALSERMAYATPVVAEVLGTPTLIVSTAERVVGLSPATGEELWAIAWRVSYGLACTQPVVVADDRIVLSAGYGKGAEMFALQRSEGGVTAESMWRSSRFKTRFNEPIRFGPHLYGLDEGTLTCVRIEDGKREWKEGSYGYGQLLLAGDRLVLMDERGSVRVVEATPEERRELSFFEAFEGGMTLNVPAIAHGLLYVRSNAELACYDLRPSTP
ncbi:MAG: PQQ-binding-like beta-propeller repeat protein [Planctomycetota bacterium]